MLRGERGLRTMDSEKENWFCVRLVLICFSTRSGRREGAGMYSATPKIVFLFCGLARGQRAASNKRYKNGCFSIGEQLVFGSPLELRAFIQNRRVDLGGILAIPPSPLFPRQCGPTYYVVQSKPFCLSIFSIILFSSFWRRCWCFVFRDASLFL